MTVGDLVYEHAQSQKNSTGYENVYAFKPPGKFYTPSSAASTRLSPSGGPQTPSASTADSNSNLYYPKWHERKFFGIKWVSGSRKLKLKRALNMFYFF